MNSEQEMLARFMDLARKAYQQNIYTYSDFITPSDYALLDENRDKYSFVDYEFFGGNEVCERGIVGFGSERMFGYEGTWPINVVKVEPLIEKFADELNHRDFLGALMNLGIERSVIGDILVKDSKRAYIFCLDRIADYIAENLTKIRHTNVRAQKIESPRSLEELKPKLEEMQVIVASTRLDAIIAALTKKSRTETLNLFKSKQITLNGKVSDRNSISPKQSDIFSVRGYGKYVYAGSGNQTRKGRIFVHLKKYT